MSAPIFSAPGQPTVPVVVLRSLLIGLLGCIPVARTQQCAVPVTPTLWTRVFPAETVCATGSPLPSLLHELGGSVYSTLGSMLFRSSSTDVGVNALLVPAIDWVSSEMPLTTSQLFVAPDLKLYPATTVGVGVVYNIPSLGSLPLVLDRTVLPAIFLGDMYLWTDPAILDLQSEEVRNVLGNLSDPTIKVVVNDDANPVTALFTRALADFDPTFASRITPGETVDWCEDGFEALSCPSCANCTDNVALADDVNGEFYHENGTCVHNPAKQSCLGAEGQCEGVSWVLNTGFRTSGTVTCAKAAHGGRLWTHFRGYKTGSISTTFLLQGGLTYSTLDTVDLAGLPSALMVNNAGANVEMSVSSVRFAVSELGGNGDATGFVSLNDARSWSAWPMVSYTYFVLRRGCGVRDRVTDQRTVMTQR